MYILPGAGKVLYKFDVILSGAGKVLSTWEVVAETEVTSHPTSCS